RAPRLSEHAVTSLSRKVKIVATRGPATDSEERLEALMRSGLDVVRLNFSHGTQKEHGVYTAGVRAWAARRGRPIAILQDLQGPKIRTGLLDGGGPVTLQTG